MKFKRLEDSAEESLTFTDNLTLPLENQNHCDVLHVAVVNCQSICTKALDCSRIL